MAATRSATATWEGDLLSGAGTVSSATTEFWSDLPTSWGARTEAPGGKTSPEEFLAAAHASCFSMAFSNQLAKQGTPPERVEVRADVTADKREAGWTVISSHLTVRGWVSGADEESFQAAAEAAKDGCPISRALMGNVELSVDATLESAPAE
ncbi:MAG: OsmC family peroxiredoxin [Candidatus Limnocylindrales bacterium]